MNEYYDKLSKGYDELYGEEQRRKYETVKDWLLQLEKPIIDVGSGTGIINEFIKPAILTDSSIEMLKKATGQRVCCDARFLPFKSKSFKSVTCFTVLQDVIEKDLVIKELTRVSSDKIIITVLKKLKTREQIEQLFKNLEELDYREEDKDHCFLLKHEEVKKEEIKQEEEEKIVYTTF